VKHHIYYIEKSEIMSVQNHTSSPGCYARAVDFAQRYISPNVLEKVESSLVHATTCVPFIMGALSQVSNDTDSNEFSAPSLSQMCTGTAIVVGGMAVGMMAIMQFNKRIKTPFVKHEIKKAIESSKDSPKTMLVFHTSLDPFGAFSTHVEVSRYRQLAKTHSIDVISSASGSIVDKRMDLNKEKYDIIIIKCHADSEVIALTKDAYLTAKSPRMKWFKDHLKEGGIITLECCKAGKGEENIARKLSRACPQALVYASSDDIDVIDGIQYDKDGNPSFNNGICCKGKDTTRIYHKGNLEYSVSS